MYERTVFESISHRHVVSVAPHASVLETAWTLPFVSGFAQNRSDPCHVAVPRRIH